MPKRYAELPLAESLKCRAVEEHSPFAYHTACARYRFAARFLTPESTVIDIGCGHGYGARILAETAAKVHAVDEDAAVIDYARAYFAHANIEYQAGDCFALDFGLATFDVVTCFEVIEHLKEPERLIARCLEWLKPGGRLVMSTPNKLVHLLMGIRWEFHEREYGYSELEALFRRFADEDHFTIYGENPHLIEHFRHRRGRFAQEDSAWRKVVRALLPHLVIAAIRKVVPRRPRPVSPEDPVVREASTIDQTNVDLCDTFVIVVEKPA